MTEAFTSALLLITAQELGDKTFFIVLILALHHPRRWVLVGAIAALSAMTGIAVVAGQLFVFLPPALIHYLFVGLFLSFGLWLILQAQKSNQSQPLSEATTQVQKFEAREDQTWHQQFRQNQAWLVILEAFSLTFVAEWGDRTQLATMALATTQNPWGVIAGGVAGHSLSSVIAAIGGRWVAGRISEKTITWIGGILFLGFGLVKLIQGPGP